jgi:hypothetical protein
VSIVPHAAAGLFTLGMIFGSLWLMVTHFRAYGDEFMAALLMEAR